MSPLGRKRRASERLESIEDSKQLESIEDSKQPQSSTDSEELKSTADSIPPCEKCDKDTSELCSSMLNDLVNALCHLMKVKGLTMKKYVEVLYDLDSAEKKAKATYFQSLSVDSQMSYIEENYGL
ncbi:hypothetical protein M5689_012215 [Euphorbia peplus]|nr:hypothetical protein M5689_012215 [Euphorbia peplus]